MEQIEFWKMQQFLSHLSNFSRSLELPLINYKVELKLKWAKYCIVSAAGADNTNNIDSNNIILTIKDTELYVPIVTYQQNTIKNYQNFLAIDLKDQFIKMNIQEKVRIKILQMDLDVFANHILLESIYYLL